MKSFNEWRKLHEARPGMDYPEKSLEDTENWDWGSGKGGSANSPSQLKEGDIVIFFMPFPPHKGRYGVVVESTNANRIQSNNYGSGDFGYEKETKDDEVHVLYSLFGEPKIINVKTKDIQKEYDSALVSKFIKDGHHQSPNKYHPSDEGTYAGISELVRMAIKEGVKF